MGNANAIPAETLTPSIIRSPPSLDIRLTMAVDPAILVEFIVHKFSDRPVPACIRPIGVTWMEQPGLPPTSSPMIDRPETVISPFVTAISATNLSASLTNFAAARA